MNAAQRAKLLEYLEFCEAHPEAWARPHGIRLPLGPVDMTFDEVEALFDRPTLTDVRAAVEEYIAGETP